MQQKNIHIGLDPTIEAGSDNKSASASHVVVKKTDEAVQHHARCLRVIFGKLSEEAEATIHTIDAPVITTTGRDNCQIGI